MARRYDTVTLLSDLGVVDETVGVLHAVLRERAPHARVVDLTHGIAPHDVRAGSLALARAVAYLPAGVVVAAVDAAAHRSIAVEVAGGEGVLLGPDNGLLASAVAMAGGGERAVVLDREQYHLPRPAAMLMVRDVLVSVAAHLCNGVPLVELGREVDVDSLLPGVVPLPREADDGAMLAEVLWVDSHGACQLNLGADDLAPWGHLEGAKLQVSFGEANDLQVRVAQRAGAVAQLNTGAIGLVVDHTGMLAVVLSRRSAADELGLAVGDQITVAPLAEGQGAPAVAVTLRR